MTKWLLLGLILGGWFSAASIVNHYKVSPPAQLERLHRSY